MNEWQQLKWIYEKLNRIELLQRAILKVLDLTTEEIQNMDAKTQELLQDEENLESKVDTLVTSFATQKQQISDLQNTVNSLQLSDADKAAIQTHIDNLTAESAKVDSALG